MSKCRFSKKLVDFFYGGIKEEEKLLIEEHISRCKECRNWIDSASLISSNYKRKELPFEGYISWKKEKIQTKIRFLRFPAVVSLMFILLLTVGIFQKVNDILTHFHLYNNLGVISCLDEITPLIVDMENQQQQGQNE